MATQASTPLSPSSTLTPPSPVLTKNSTLPYPLNASTVVELVSSRSDTTSALFIYDLAEQAGFGSLTKSWSKSDQSTTSVVSLQTRAGAGLSLVGRLTGNKERYTCRPRSD